MAGRCGHRLRRSVPTGRRRRSCGPPGSGSRRRATTAPPSARVAADAGIDPSMVMRYFGTKAQALRCRAGHRPAPAGPDRCAADELPRMLVRLFLDRWESDPAGRCPAGAAALRGDQRARRGPDAGDLRRAGRPRAGRRAWPELAARRAGLVAAQLLGLGLTRYLLRLPAVTALTRRRSKTPSPRPSKLSSDAIHGAIPTTNGGRRKPGTTWCAKFARCRASRPS